MTDLNGKSYDYSIHELIERVIDAQVHVQGSYPNGQNGADKAVYSREKNNLIASLSHTRKILLEWRNAGQSRVVSSVNLNQEGEDGIQLTRLFAENVTVATESQSIKFAQGGVVQLNAAHPEPAQV